ncbi:amidohydrolase family protein, partial [Candidatus Woesearchaeota archaeon]|nr:amidohydrolase family protein [Candidatus Woesearchaeota archaeon]
ENDIVDLMDKYPNVYFSIDSAVLYAMQGLFMGSKEQFVSRFEQEFDVNMNRAVNKWKSAVEKHPDRFMWGSDRGLPWHYDEDVSILFEEFGRAFIARLDPAVQEKFAYENAERLLQG